MARRQEAFRKDEGCASRIHITNATFIFIDALGNDKQFTVTESGEYITVTLREREEDRLQELYDEMLHITKFSKGDLVDLIVSPRRWGATPEETTYFLISIKRSDDARKG